MLDSADAKGLSELATPGNAVVAEDGTPETVGLGRPDTWLGPPGKEPVLELGDAPNGKELDVPEKPAGWAD